MNLQLIETACVLALLLIVLYINKRAVSKVLKRLELGLNRRRVISKAINGISVVLAAIVLAAIWGVHHNQIVVFLTSFLTVMGIAFFAQWSLLSNITSGIILFFNHPLHIGDTIEIYDKEFPVQGRVVDITYFFVHIRTEQNVILTIPNSLMLQKMVSVKPEQAPEAASPQP
jgi:small-conductance mechanosensitive channel